MSQSSPFFNRWLSQVGPDMAIEVLSDLVDVGAVFAVDAAGKILFWSRGAERMSGLPAERAVGTPCTEAFGCEEGIDLCGLAEQGVIKGQSVTLKLRGGAGIACYRTARAFFDAEGRFAGAIEFLRPESQTAPAAAVPATPVPARAPSFPPPLLSPSKKCRHCASRDSGCARNCS